MIRILCASLLALVVTGCHGIVPTQPTPFNPADFAPIVPPPPVAPPPGPHFALEIHGDATATDREPWVGQVSVWPNPSILRPEMPARVVTTCGSSTQTLPLGFGFLRVSCLLPLGAHTITAVAEMADGRRYGTAISVTVGRTITTDLFIMVHLADASSSHRLMGFAVDWDPRVYRYHWDFGDLQDATALPSIQRWFPRIAGAEPPERTLTLLAVDRYGHTLATGSVVGRW